MSSKRGKGKRPKATPITDISGTDAVLKGRRSCLCEATKHELVANCLNCGRIVCAQEGVGECFTCGLFVCNKKDRNLQEFNNQLTQMNENVVSKHSNGINNGDNAPNKGLRDIAASLESAVKHKNKMLEYDRNASVRTKVIDDENDYFSLTSQNWITNEKRKELTVKVDNLHQNKNKTNKKIMIDLVNHSAVGYEEPVIPDFNDKVKQLEEESAIKSKYETVDTSTVINKSDQKLPILLYIDKNANNKNKKSNNAKQIEKKLIYSFAEMRIQDKELMLMSDEGMCLSINQPFASFLIFGIKKFEGRSWYTSFRGRLWIHASGKKPTPTYLQDMENFYRHSGAKNLPSSYPTSALLGCVTLTDCLPFEEYAQKYPNGDTEANYIFVCDDPKQLQKPFPMSGKNKLFKLDQTILNAAQKSISF